VTSFATELATPIVMDLRTDVGMDYGSTDTLAHLTYKDLLHFT